MLATSLTSTPHGATHFAPARRTASAYGDSDGLTVVSRTVFLGLFLFGWFAFLYNGDTTPLLFGGLFSLFLFTVFLSPFFFIICSPPVVFPTFGGVVAYRARHTAHWEFVDAASGPRGGFFIFSSLQFLFGWPGNFVKFGIASFITGFSFLLGR